MHSGGQRAGGIWLRAGFWSCVVIAVGVAVRRILALAYPPRNVPLAMAGLDAGFAAHPGLTLAHVLPALAFVLVAPFAVARRGWAQAWLFPLGLVVGATAYAMSRYAVGGWVERSAVLFFNSLFLFSLLRAYLARRQPALRRRWMLRAIVVLLGIATTRPVMGVFFATRGLTHLEPRQFFGIAFWIGFSINTIAFELWARSRPARPRLKPPSIPPLHLSREAHG